jgi:hypothetical protein
MIAEIDIFRCARVLIDQHGGGALLEAMHRLEQYRAIGNTAGMQVWHRIGDAIKTLQIPAHLGTQTSH